MVIMPSFTSKAAAKLVGISFRQLDYLDRTGCISPTGTLMHKKRSPRVYSYTDLIGLATANRLLSLGIKIADLENALSSLQEQINKIHPPYNDYFFVTDLNNQHRLVRSEDEIIELGHVLKGTVQGRESPEDWTLFKSIGTAAQDVLCGWHVYHEALARGVGQKVTVN